MQPRLTWGVVLGLAGALCLSTAVRAAQDAPVAEAAMRGDRDAVRSLLRDGADVNAAQGDGMTALHWAAMNDDVAMTKMLLYAGANVKATSRLGNYTPLLLAARHGDAGILTALLDAGSEAKETTSNGTTPLMMAATSGSVESVNVLIEHGADVNAKETAKEETALMFAAAYDRVGVVKALVQHGADVSATTKVVDLSELTRGGRGGRRGGGDERSPAKPQVAGLDRQFRYNELVGTQGGITPLIFAARQGFMEAVKTLVDAGADVNQVSAGDQSSPLLIATINGHFDVGEYLLSKGADVTLAAQNGVTPVYAALNVQWAPKALYPQPRAYLQQHVTYLEFMKHLLDKGADPNVRLVKKVWYSGYNFDLSGVDEIGATPFWRAAYASDVDAMQLLVSYGADPNIPTMKPAGRPRTGDSDRLNTADVSGAPPIPTGGPGVTPLQAAAGVGYGEGFAANSHRNAPGSWLRAVQYLVEDLGADVNAADHEGNTALHNAAARGDNEMIQYLVAHGADVTRVNREGKTVADMANGPVQRTQPFPETVALLEKLGSKNNHKCVSC